MFIIFFFSSRRRHTRYWRDWSSDVCSSDLAFVVSKAHFERPETQLWEIAFYAVKNRRLNCRFVAGCIILHEIFVIIGFMSCIICGIQDRKSTRLNSSHANISYAVFCLKKKKKQ